MTFGSWSCHRHRLSHSRPNGRIDFFPKVSDLHWGLSLSGLYGCPIRRLYRLCLSRCEVLRIPFFSLLFLSFTFRLQRLQPLSFRLAESPHFGTKYSGLYLHTRKRTTKVGKTLGNSKCFAYLCCWPNGSRPIRESCQTKAAGVNWAYPSPAA